MPVSFLSPVLFFCSVYFYYLVSILYIKQVQTRGCSVAARVLEQPWVQFCSPVRHHRNPKEEKGGVGEKKNKVDFLICSYRRAWASCGGPFCSFWDAVKACPLTVCILGVLVYLPVKSECECICVHAHACVHIGRARIEQNVTSSRGPPPRTPARSFAPRLAFLFFCAPWRMKGLCVGISTSQNV